MDFRSGRPRKRVERRRANRPLAERVKIDRREGGLAVIRWMNADGTESAGHPLPRPHAEALLRAFQQHFPLPQYWLEVPPALAQRER